MTFRRAPVEQAHAPAVGVGPRRRATLALASTLATLAALALTASPASAAEFHGFSTSFGEAGSGNGQLALAEHSGLALNIETGDLYVADSGNNRVEQFSSSGAFVRTFATLTDPSFIAVDNSGGPSNEDVYVADSADSTISKFTAAGVLIESWGTSGHLDGAATPGGAFGELLGIAVNASGDLFVLSGGTRMSTFEADGSFGEEFAIQYPAGPRGIAVDNSAGASAGDIYTRYAGGPEVLKFSPTGGLLGEPDTAAGTGLAVDSASGDLYVDHGTQIARYGPGGEHLESFGSSEPEGGGLSSAGGLAVGPSHTVYVADAGNQRIDAFAFEPGVTLTVTPIGSGSGEVTSSPSGIECGATCEAEFAKGTTVTLTAIPKPGSHFVEWVGLPCDESTATTCEIEMSAAESMEAKFAPTLHTLTVIPTGPGEASATSPASGIAGCSAEPPGGTCAAEYQEGSTVVLTATPGAHHHIAWSGCTPKENPAECELTIGASDETVDAEFPINTHTLTVIHSGLGSVSADSGPISGCSAAAGTCSGAYDETSTLTLTATPAAHRHIAWQGCAPKPSNEDECEVEIGPADQSVTAAFPPNTHTLTVTPQGPGSVRANSGAISHCSNEGGTCAGSYIEAATVTLTATPGPGYAVAWTGCAAEPRANSCEAQIGSSDSEVKASFSRIALPADTHPTAPPAANPPPPAEAAKPPPLECRKGFVRKHGHCVRKPKHHRHHRKKGKK